MIIEKVISDWHQHLTGQLPGGLDVLLDDDVVFYSPVVFTPQEGKEITKAYLMAAAGSLGGENAATVSSSNSKSDRGKFRYTKKVLAGDTACLEFETTVGGKFVNGMDIIRANEAGKIVEFRVMIRPLQAVNAVHAQMKTALKSMQKL